jgi:O-antigen ligase
LPISSPATPSEESIPDGRTSRFERPLLVAALATILVLAPVLGLLTSYAVVLVALIFAIRNLARGRRARWNLLEPGKTFLAAFAALALLFSLTARQPDDVVFALNFVSFIFFVPLATLFDRNAAPNNSIVVAWLALAGAAVACAASLFEIFGLGYSRAGSIFSDHIRLANTAVILGFIALIGMIQKAGRGRWVFLLGPTFALIVVLLTGARIAMLAFPVLAFGALLLLVRHKAMALLLGALVVSALGLAAFAGMFGSARLASLFSVAAAILEGEPVGDEAVRIRLELYKAGWAAFQESPFIGHGWARLMSTPARYLAESDQHREGLPHLHNELLNFAVFGGVAGILLYLGLLASPLLAAWRSVRDSQYGARLVGTSLLVLSYVVMGLTDTMISFELHTSLYVGFTAVLLAYCRDQTFHGGARA